MLNKDTFMGLLGNANKLHHHADILVHHILSKRVSHTKGTVIRCVLALAKLVRIVQEDKNFSLLFKRTLEQAHEKAGGSMEVTFYEDGTVFINGSFYVDKLRDGLITIPKANMLLEQHNDK